MRRLNLRVRGAGGSSEETEVIVDRGPEKAYEKVGILVDQSL